MSLLSTISFPHLSPIAFRIGPLAVRWYGVAYVAGFVLAYVVLRVMSRIGRLRLSRERLSDLMGWLVLGVLAGGRIGWWLFYHRGGAVEPWYEPFAIWHGGMSFHGGLIGVAVVLALFAAFTHASLWNLADAAALVTPIGLFFGRIANFINAELVGRPSDLPWAVVFPGETFARHPSQIYEAFLEGPLLLAAIWLVSPRSRQDGTVAGAFLWLYGIIRFSAEFTREPDAQIGFIAFGWLTLGQLLSVVLAAAGLVIALFRIIKPDVLKGETQHAVAPEWTIL